MSMMKKHPITKMINSTLIDLPSPSSITFYWNFGSLLGLTLMFQIMSGLMMTFHYTPDTSLAFSSLILASRNTANFWLLRWIHANGASLMFILIYLHIARNIYFFSFKKLEVWLSGILIFLIMMMIAFMGYVLPWGQMSYWGVTVITNLLTALPYVGQNIMTWLWGDYSVNNATLKRFYSLHFLLPFIMTMMVILHLVFLHQYGSSNPLGLANSNDMLYFHPFFTIKDLLGLLSMLLLFFLMSLTNPLILNDPENFMNANIMLTPTHIQPEWYFLFAYTILRSIPSKLGGVIALLMSIMILFFLPTMNNKIPMKFNFIKKITFWSLMSTFLILTWIGMNPTNYPFTLIGSISSFMYFMLMLIIMMNLNLPNYTKGNFM